ncbi:MAG: 50S ribosomal protein L21 [Candidatus Omnitrophica bacterium]|nr:50S ribosomal protein L21 [Candidatus Omnitrophota bacterium]
MYAIIEVGAMQYKVSEGDVILVDRLEKEAGDSLTVEKVLLLEKDGDVRIGQPYVDGAKVEADVNKQILDDKVIAFKYRRRKDSAVKNGHRQKLTSLTIKKIAA